MTELINTVIQSTDEMRNAMATTEVASLPQFFHLTARLPKQGRTDTAMALTDKMWVVLKAYASSGENELHAHPNEDHVFVVLQGRCQFEGPRGGLQTIGLHEGVLLPRGTFYKFCAVSEEPLVMLRVGALIKDGEDPLARIDELGGVIDGFSAANKRTEVILHDDLVFS